MYQAKSSGAILLSWMGYFLFGFYVPMGRLHCRTRPSFHLLELSGHTGHFANVIYSLIILRTGYNDSPSSYFYKMVQIILRHHTSHTN